MKATSLKIFLSIALTSVISYKSTAQVVTVDNYFNQETIKDSFGKERDFHYLWSDKEMSGFSIFGAAFTANGAKVLNVLHQKPSLKNLAHSDVYIIVDPDNLKDNPKPNYIKEADAVVISEWVKAGGVLFLLANDQINADLENLNILARKFGFTFNNDLILHVADDEHFADGGLNTGHSPIFKTSKRIFIKDASSISIQHTAKPILKTEKGENVIVVSKFGKGTVLAVGDPWLYNEYTNGRLPADFQNDKAAHDIAKFLISKIR